MKKLLALVLAGVMALSMVACGGSEEETPKSTIDEILEKGYITVAISPDFAPSEFKDPSTGEVMGTDVEYAKYVANYISEKYGKTVELKIEEMDFKSCQAAVAAGAVDFSVNGYAATEERMQNYICAGPYAVISAEEDTYHGALVKKGLKLETAEDFKGLKIGAQQASLQYNLAVEQLPLDEMEEIELVTNLNMGAMMVATDKIDALITDSGAGELLITNNADLEMAAFKFEYESEGNVALVNIDETELGDLITEALTQSNTDIDYDTIRQEMVDKAVAMGVEVN
ncbi:MAG: transporter substrate-binding domain-containing protein [Oscillospiraceae bacterium]|nr:transporter substrate-binding domain-containing protein [Oscillospiraceae bacterium]